MNNRKNFNKVNNHLKKISYFYNKTMICSLPESNRHLLIREWILSPSRLPIPPNDNLVLINALIEVFLISF